MKTLIFFWVGLILGSVFAGASSESFSSPPSDYVKWLGPTIAVDNIPPSSNSISRVFSFKNNSSRPVKIKSVVVSCSCTSAVYTYTWLQAGAEGSVTLKYTNSIAGFGKKTGALVSFEDGGRHELCWDIKTSPAATEKNPLIKQSESFLGGPKLPEISILSWPKGNMDTKTVQVFLGKNQCRAISSKDVNCKISPVPEAEGLFWVEITRVNPSPFWSKVSLFNDGESLDSGVFYIKGE